MGKSKSFSEAILEEPKRFLKYIEKQNSNIKTFEQFENAFRVTFNTPQGQNGKIENDDIITLFETDEAKEMISKNTTQQEYDDIYGDGKIVKRESINKKEIITISAPKVNVQKSKDNRKAYTRIKAQKYKPIEEKFISVRKQKGIPRKQIIQQYQEHFKDNPRTAKSISSKIYRT